MASCKPLMSTFRRSSSLRDSMATDRGNTDSLVCCCVELKNENTRRIREMTQAGVRLIQHRFNTTLKVANKFIYPPHPV